MSEILDPTKYVPIELYLKSQQQVDELLKMQVEAQEKIDELIEIVCNAKDINI
jgi:hypothetical protein